MKFKKFILCALAVIMCLPAVLLAGCGKQKGIDLPTYINSRVTYQAVGKTGANNYLKLSDFTGKKFEIADQFTRITFTGDANWLYRMTIDYIEFDIYSNQNVDNFEFVLDISNMVNGDETLTSSNRTHTTERIRCVLVENGYYHVKVEINDTFASNSATTTIVFRLPDTTCYRQSGEDTGLKIGLCGLRIYGGHR